MKGGKLESEILAMYPWITHDYFEKILQKNIANPDDVIKFYLFTLKEVSAKGQQYASELIRAVISYKRLYQFNNRPIVSKESSALIMKMNTQEVGKNEVSADLNILLREINVHQYILPKVHELLLSINYTKQLSARCFDCSDNPIYMIFEDLTHDRYKNVDRECGLDFEHLKIVLSKLAQWHATTAVLMDKDALLFKTHMKPIAEYKALHMKAYKNILLAFAEVAENWSGYENIAKKLLKTIINLNEKCANVYDNLNDNEFNVLGLGDLWCNNIMFKTIIGETVEDSILVDYSGGFWRSPGIDLSNLLFTSSNVNVQEKEWDQLILHYYIDLIAILDGLHFAGKYPTLIGIHDAIMKRGISSAIISICVVGMRTFKRIIGDIELDLFIGETTKDHEFRVKMLSDPKCMPELQYRLDYFDRKGYFD